MTKNVVETINKRWLVLLVAAVALVVLVLSSWLWWQKIYTNPRRVFWGMIGNSLSTPGVTRHITQNSEQGSLDQFMQLQFGAQNTAHMLTTLSQPGANGTSTVKSENIGTPQADYIRYQSIDTKQLNQQGKPLDFSKVTNLWGKSDASQAGQGGVQLFKEAAFGFIPFTELRPADRQALVKLMQAKTVYNVSYNTAAHKSENGRPVTVYDASLNPQAYIEMLQQLAMDMGYGKLTELSPDAYRGVPPVKLQLTVDTLSRQLTRIHYVDANRDEAYTGHGITQPLALPANALPIAELQKRLQSIH